MMSNGSRWIPVPCPKCGKPVAYLWTRDGLLYPLRAVPREVREPSPFSAMFNSLGQAVSNSLPRFRPGPYGIGLEVDPKPVPLPTTPTGQPLADDPGTSVDVRHCETTWQSSSRGAARHLHQGKPLI
jgi:hypothetical protein